MTRSRQIANKYLIWCLVGVLVAMFAFAYALVPLYDVMCRVLGINGKTGDAYTEMAIIDDSRIRPVSIHFTTSVAPGLPIVFHSEEKNVTIRTGDFHTTYYAFTNLGDMPLVAQAVPSVAPGNAAPHLRKLDCFCYSQQTLAPRETKKLAVRFFVDTALPDDVSEFTLSYVFYPSQSASSTGTDGIHSPMIHKGS